MTQPNPKSRNSNPLLRSDSRERCLHRTASGRRCRIPAADAQSGLCSRHQVPATKVDVAATLTAGLDDFTDPVQINTFLSRLLLLLAQDKITTKRASVLTYISSQLLHSVPTIQKHEDKQPVEIIFDIPRPQRPDYVEPPKREPAEPINRQSAPASVSQPVSHGGSHIDPQPPNPQQKCSAPPQAASQVQPPSQSITPTDKKDKTPQPGSQAPVSSHPGSPAHVSSQAASPASPATLPNPALPGSFGLPQANPLGPRAASTRQHVRQPTWADLDS